MIAGGNDEVALSSSSESASGAQAAPVDSALPDETTFVLPASWARQAEPFRGLRPAPRLEIDPAATLANAQALRQQKHDAVRRVLEHPSSNENLVEHAERQFGAPSRFLRREKRENDATGAAVLLTALMSILTWEEREPCAQLLADELVLRHGPVFAAEVGALLGGVEVVNMRGGPRNAAGSTGSVQPPAAGAVDPWAPRKLLGRLRAHVTGTDDKAYAQVVTRLGELRDGPLAVRVLTSYLAPTQSQWVADDIAALAATAPRSLRWPLLLASSTTRAQVESILPSASSWWVSQCPELLYSVAANLGIGAVRPLATVFDDDGDAAAKKRLLALISTLPTDDAFIALVDRIDQKYVPPTVIETAARYPVRALRVLAARAAGSDAKARACRDILRGHLLANPEIATRSSLELDDASRLAIESIGRASPVVPVADADHLPSILVTPPWQARRKRAKPLIIAGLRPSPGFALLWGPGERDEWAQLPGFDGFTRRAANDWNAAIREAVDPSTRFGYRALRTLAAAPPDLVRPHLARFRPTYTSDALPSLMRILGGVGDEAIEFTWRVVMTKPVGLAPALLPIEGEAVASRMADWLVRTKSLRPLARAWLERHPDAAARDLIPAALSKPGRERTAAETALRVLDHAGHRDILRAAAARFSPEAHSAIDSALDADPLLRLPTKIPALPAWLAPTLLPQVLLPGRATSVSADAVGTICTMLAISKPGDPYAGIDVVKRSVDPASLASLAWGMFERWQSAEYPAKEGWVLESLGLIGDDETVRRLTPLIRAWPGEGAHARAVSALDVLSNIGTDVALMHLHGIAEKAKFAGLKRKARAKMDEVAEGLGLSAEQLADRLVPDFGLDENGSLVLDYGPRRFIVGFDEQLKPIVADEDGSRRKALPKPGPKDDEGRATAAYAAFGGLKKDVKTIAADQIRRFERAMVLGRRWTAAEQRRLFIEHPLLWNLTRRLVWATFDRNGAATAFRVAEDRTLADVADNELVLADDITVGIAHPLHLGGALASWNDVFADYEILQPFQQLARDTWHLTDAEQSSNVLRRLTGVSIETGRVLGLAHRGWDRGAVMDGGISSVVQKVVAGGRFVVMDLDPGIIAGAAMEWKEQKVNGVWISDSQAEWGNDAGQLPFAVLDPVSASEVLRDIEHLRG